MDELLEIVHMTTAYSNAVLAAFLPQVSEYARKLDLPVVRPVTIEQVKWAKIAPVRTGIYGGLRLTNNYWFEFDNGGVHRFRCPRIAMLDEDPRTNWPKYAFGKSNMTTNDAVGFVREALTKLGYSLVTLHADSPPTKIEGPYDLDGGKYHMPECIVDWKHGNDLVRGFVHLGRKELLGLTVIVKATWRADPKIAVVPELEKEYRARMLKEGSSATEP